MAWVETQPEPSQRYTLVTAPTLRKLSQTGGETVVGVDIGEILGVQDGLGVRSQPYGLLVPETCPRIFFYGDLFSDRAYGLSLEESPTGRGKLAA